MQIRQILGHHIDAKISPKAASEKVQTTVSENRYTSPNIDVFRTAILTLIAPTEDNARASFLVHQVPRTSSTVWRYRQIFTQFSLRVWASDYTCRPITYSKCTVSIRYFTNPPKTGDITRMRKLCTRPLLGAWGRGQVAVWSKLHTTAITIYLTVHTQATIKSCCMVKIYTEGMAFLAHKSLRSNLNFVEVDCPTHSKQNVCHTT